MRLAATGVKLIALKVDTTMVAPMVMAIGA